MNYFQFRGIHNFQCKNSSFKIVMYYKTKGCLFMVNVRNACKILSENLQGRDHLGDLSVDVRIMLKWILKE